jgi:hypothetical protein
MKGMNQLDRNILDTKKRRRIEHFVDSCIGDLPRSTKRLAETAAA